MNDLTMLSLVSERDGNITGMLSYNFNPLLTTYWPARINDMLKEKISTSFLFIGEEDVVRCSFPLTPQDLIAVLARVENAAQARFIQRLDGDYSAFGT